MHATTQSRQGRVQETKNLVTQRLQSADVGTERSCSVKNGSKKCLNHENRSSPNKISGNYNVFGGKGLVILDIDVPIGDLPNWVRKLPRTFVVETPHSGYHLYYTVEDGTGVSNAGSVSWGSIRYGWYAVGPGSTIDHERNCDDGKEGCPGMGKGKYEVVADRSIATLSEENIRHLRRICDSSTDSGKEQREYGGGKITFPEERIADEGEEYICRDFSRYWTPLADEDLMDLLRGGTGSYSLRREDDTGIDRSAADYFALDMLYGAFQFKGEDKEKARKHSLAVFKRYCRENPYDKTGNPRKWLQNGESYLQEQMDAVQQGFNFGEWHRWRRRQYKHGFEGEEHKPWTHPEKDGKPSDITNDTVQATLYLITTECSFESVSRMFGLDLSTPSPPPPSCGEMCTPRGSAERGITSTNNRSYPTADRVGKVAAELNPERKASYFEEVLKKLSRETGGVAHAYCPSRPNGERHVYYPQSMEDPQDARWVKVGGERVDQFNPTR